MQGISVDGHRLTLQDVVNVASKDYLVNIDSSVRATMDKTWNYLSQVAVRQALALANKYQQTKEEGLSESEIQELRKKLIYGVTTGFGALKGTIVQNEDSARALQKNIVLSHSTGVGEPLDEKIVRATMVIRVNTLVTGRCGVRYELAERLAKFINAGVIPMIPEQGSVGASGDLCPLAHMTLALIGRGKAKKKGEPNHRYRETKEVLDEAGIDSGFQLDFKEGLALVNGTAVMTAIAVLTYDEAMNLLRHADIAGALTLEGIAGQTRAFDKLVHETRPFEGQKISARNILRLVGGSKLLNKILAVHDPYSVRCIPQVHGAAREALGFIKGLLATEINSVTDDPIFFTKEEVEENPPYDGILDRLHFEEGNFHGQPISLAMDLLGIALSTIGTISERRIQMLLDDNHNRGLPLCLIHNPKGEYSGFMLAQYTAASLASENKILSHPASVDTIPTSANTEDHVSMGTIAARKAWKILQHVHSILAIELLVVTQSLDFRMGDLPLESGKPVIKGMPGDLSLKIYNLIRSKISPLTEDRELYVDIQEVEKMIRNREILGIVNEEIS